MKPEQFLDSFSETLNPDGPINRVSERVRLTNPVAQARTVSLDKTETHTAIHSTIATALGETVAQQALAALGGSIVERILAAGIDPSKAADLTVHAAASRNWPLPSYSPDLPITNSRPFVGVRAVWRSTAVIPARCLVLDEFLAPQELHDLILFAIECEGDFSASEVVARHADNGMVNQEHRRSRVLMNLGKHQDVVLDRIQAALPVVLHKLDMKDLSISNVETQITVSNDGDFFRSHTDDGDPRVASRRLTFVYFFHREPRQFDGGELRIYDSQREGSGYQTIVPQQNQIVFFPSFALHEITPVECPSRLFVDSRFTLNGWLHT